MALVAGNDWVQPYVSFNFATRVRQIGVTVNGVTQTLTIMEDECEEAFHRVHYNAAGRIFVEAFIETVLGDRLGIYGAVGGGAPPVVDTIESCKGHGRPGGKGLGKGAAGPAVPPPVAP